MNGGNIPPNGPPPVGFQNSVGYLGCSLTFGAVAGYDFTPQSNHQLFWIRGGAPPYNTGGGAIKIDTILSTTGNTTQLNNQITNLASTAGITTSLYASGPAGDNTVIPNSNRVTAIAGSTVTLTNNILVGGTHTAYPVRFGGFGQPGYATTNTAEHYWLLFNAQGINLMGQPKVMWVELCLSYVLGPDTTYNDVKTMVNTLLGMVTTPHSRIYISGMTQFNPIDYCPTENSNGANPNVPPFTRGDGAGTVNTQAWAAQAVTDFGIVQGPLLTVDATTHGVGSANPYVQGPGGGLPYCDPTQAGMVDYGRQLALFFDALYSRIDQEDYELARDTAPMNYHGGNGPTLMGYRQSVPELLSLDLGR